MRRNGVFEIPALLIRMKNIIYELVMDQHLLLFPQLEHVY